MSQLVNYNDLNNSNNQPVNHKNQGTGFTNVNQYVNANQNNQLGQTVAGGISGQATTTNNNLNQAQTDFQNQSAQNQANTDQNKQLVNNVLADPASNASTQNGQKFQQLMSGQYQGPQGIANQQQLQNQINDVGQMGQATNTAAGQQGLLQRFVGGNNNYNAGQQTFDQLLLGQTGAPQLQQAKQQALQLQAQAPRVFQGAQNQAQQYANEAKQFGQNVQQQFGNTVNQFNQGLQQTAAQDQASRDAAYNKAVNDFKNGTISQNDANLLGLTKGQEVTNDFLQNAGNFLTKGTAATAQNVASADDYARINALAQLGGNFAPAAAQNILGQYSGQDSQAGKFAASGDIIADKDAAQNALSAQLANAHSILDPAKAAVDQDQQFVNWANGNLTPDQIAQAKSYMDAHGGSSLSNPFASVQSTNNNDYGQALWNQYLTNTYGPSLGGNSPLLKQSWANTQLSQAQAAQQDALQKIKDSYGGLTNLNIPDTSNS